MLNFVIADDNIYYSKSLIDHLNISSLNIKLLNICINGKEVINSLINNEIVCIESIITSFGFILFITSSIMIVAFILKIIFLL